ncbi:hypothetical protein SNOG_13947 [Parastagonospora nodorum SN15]|uniref:Uncharacterized protein n=1 Tax=Phaeosphaeria nodorum (strain SN15 / ATCC MYA-4574 / FGSC 10173) TaxID=321614 RepID=Q0U2S9_PHANO|nr:hypothetical protein SNOG_13947 [Parastagonospora nodorum SN15]EAT78572.1 hypothetical protein SNOG_13947 [Parastagonospora nodorum SN15]
MAESFKLQRSSDVCTIREAFDVGIFGQSRKVP